MEGDLVSHLYQRYRYGTTYVVDWLADTVRQQQDIAKILAISKHTQARSTGKKARHKQKKANCRGAAHTSLLQRPPPTRVQAPLVFTRRTFRPLKKCHLGGSRCDSRSPRVQPVSCEAGSRCWFMRRPSGRWSRYWKHCCSCEARRLGRRHHAYVANDSTQSASLEGAFGALDIEASFAEPLGRWPQLKPVSTHKDKLPAETSFELKQQEGDAQLALYCFLRECSQVRGAVKVIWHDHKVGKASLFVASQVTYAAKGLIQKLADDFVAGFPPYLQHDRRLPGNSS